MDRVAEALDRTPVGGVVIEVGAFRGGMAEQAASMRPDVVWVMVDRWRAVPATEDPVTSRDAGVVAMDMEQAYSAARRARASVLCMDTAQAAGLIAWADVVFIDGDHAYASVKRDIALWRPKARRWLGGHDYRGSAAWTDGVARAVDEAFASVETGRDTTWWVRMEGSR